MPESFRYGYEGVMYYSEELIDRFQGAGGGTEDFASVAWVEMDNVMDVDDTFDSDKIDTTTRAEAKKGWNSEVNTTKKAAFKFNIRWKPTDLAFKKIAKTWLSGKEISLMDLDGPFGVAANQGNQGLVGNFTLAFNRKMPVKGIMTAEVTASLSAFPDWIEVSSTGTLTRMSLT